MFVMNCWYVAAYSREVHRTRPLARTILNNKVVIFRSMEGDPVALEDRCPHRFAPLSAGKITPAGISCGYHGLEFDRGGRCILNPTQPNEKIPDNAIVKSYPVVEMYGLIWIWMGQKEKANIRDIPVYWQYGDPKWNPQTQYMHVEANYLLLVDNLLDLSHINFVHGGSLGSSDRAEKMVHSVETTETGIVEKWLSPASPIVPLWAPLIADDWGRHDVDLWADMYWEAPSNMMLDTGVAPAGQDRQAGAQSLVLSCLTPETEFTTHYFYGSAGEYWKDPSVLVEAAIHQREVFEQDKAIIEAAQSNMRGEVDILELRPLVNKADRAALMARKIVRKRISEELSQ